MHFNWNIVGEFCGMKLSGWFKEIIWKSTLDSQPHNLVILLQDEDNDEMNSGETLERPIGKKAEKEKLKKRKNCDDVIQTLSSQLDEIKEEKRRIHEEKNESMRIALEEWREFMRIASEERRELIRIKEDKNEVEKRKAEDEIIMKDTRTMDPEQKEYSSTLVGNLGEVKV